MFDQNQEIEAIKNEVYSFPGPAVAAAKKKLGLGVGSEPASLDEWQTMLDIVRGGDGA